MVEVTLSFILFVLTSVVLIGIALITAFFAGMYGLKLIDYLEHWYKSKE